MNRANSFFDNVIISLWMDFWLALPITAAITMSGYPGRPVPYFLLMLVSSYVVGIFARSITRESGRFTAATLCAAWSLIVAYMFSNSKLTGGLVVLWLYNFGVSFRGIFIAEQPERNRKNSAVYYFSGLMVYFFAYLVCLVAPGSDTYLPLLTAGGLIASASALLVVNRDVLILASRSELSRFGALTAVKRNNRLFACAIFLLTAAIAGFNALKYWVKSAVKAVLSFILDFISSLSSPPHQLPQEGGNDLPEPGLPPGGSNAADIWGLIAMITSMIVFAALAFLLARLIFRLCKAYLPRLIGLLTDLFKGNAEMAQVYYRDEQESLLDFKSLLGDAIKGIRRRLDRRKPREPSWDDLQDNRERVRFLYRSVLKRAQKEGFIPKASRTPGETIRDLTISGSLDPGLSDKLSTTYGIARYGLGEISDRETEELRRQIYHEK